MKNDSIILALRSAAMKEYRVDMANTLRNVADRLDTQAKLVVEKMSQANMIELNGLYAHGLRLLEASREPAAPLPPMASELKEAA